MFSPSWKFPILGLALAAVSPLFAVSVTTAPVGYVALPTLANSDTIISTPLARPSVFVGALSAVSGTVLTVSGVSPAWTANQFVKALPGQTNTYYVQFRSGTAAGRFYTVTANTANALTVDWNGETPAAAVGDQFELIPYWTLGTLYPASDAGVSFTPSVNIALINTSILFPDVSSAGINLPPVATFYFLNGAWRKFGQSVATSYDSTVLSPDSYFIQRNRGTPSKLVVSGSVWTGPLGIMVNAQGGTAKQDNPVSLRFGGTVTLAQSNLVGSGAFKASLNPAIFADQLLVFDGTAVGYNKPPSATYYYYNGGWRKFGSPVSQDFGIDPVFQPGAGVVIRKGGTGSTPVDGYWRYVVTGL